MGGEIEVESEEGRGSTFSFFVPAPSCGAPAVAEDLHLITSVRAEEAGPPSSPSILIVDDLAENRELSKIMLQAAGCRTMEAAGGAEAVALASEAVFDVILMDMQMPGMDGVSAARSIRASGGLNATSPILALTASVMADQIDECIAAGMNDHIAKPIRVGDLVEKVRRWSSPQGGESERTGEKEALEGGIRPPETP
jgi:CheY-like chemotaxis protein